jgi:Fe-S-cluster containining protein
VVADGDWYRNGLRFRCARCGHCCSGDTGTVRLSDGEAAALARHLDLAGHEFRAMYTRPLRGGGTRLRERANGDCVFYDGRACRVYPLRPRQCRTWPFWRAVVGSPERWAAEAKGCPGMNSGPLHGVEFIRRTTESDGTSGTIPDAGGTECRT